MFDIERFRKERKLSQGEFADKTGIGRSYVSRMENKKQPITDAVLDKIAETFGVDLEGFKSYNQQNIVSEPVEEYGNAWKEKYIELLERYNSLSDKLNQCMEDKEKLRNQYAAKVEFRNPDK